MVRVTVNNQVRVLLVEDNPGDARLVQSMLSRQGTPAILLAHVERLSSALDRLKAGDIDIALLDLHLPDAAGLEVFYRVHAAAPDLPIIVLTGSSKDEALGVQAVRDGAQDYLIKGQVDSDLLTRAISYAIERKAAQRALQQAYDGLEKVVQQRTAELQAANESLRTEMEERIAAQREKETLLREMASKELRGFAASAFTVFASGVPVQVRDAVVASFAGRFEDNVLARFTQEMNDGLRELGSLHPDRARNDRILDAYLTWVSKLFADLGIVNTFARRDGLGVLTFTSCPWLVEARDNPVFCLICRTMATRSYAWTGLGGKADQLGSIAGGSATCDFEFRPLESAKKRRTI